MARRRHNRWWLAILSLALSITLSPAAHVRVFVLTGQSNALGTTNGTETDRSPGSDPADAEVRFWWENWASESVFLGGCTNLQTLVQQQGGYYAGSATHWGPEFGFGRALWRSGWRDFMIVKCSRGGGGNSFWHKASPDHHMYTYLCRAVTNALNALAGQGHTFEIAGLLYLQGESNNSTEAAAAGIRFRALLDNLRWDLPHAGRMRGFIAGIAAAGADRETTRQQQDALHGQYAPEILYCSNLDLADEVVPADGLHFNKRAKLVIGARLADQVVGRWAAYDANRFGAFGEDPLLQGWSETWPTATNGQEVIGLGPASAGGLNGWRIEDASATVRGYYYSRQFSTRQCSWASGLGWELAARSRLLNGYGGQKAWFLQYGDAAFRWLLWAHLEPDGRLTLSWDMDAESLGPRSVVVQSTGDGQYHELALDHAGGNGAAAILFDGLVVGRTHPLAASGSLPSGVHWGTTSTAGTIQADWNRVTFQTRGFKLLPPLLDCTEGLVLRFNTQPGRTYDLHRSSNLLDWTPLRSNLSATASVFQIYDSDVLGHPPAFYRIRLNP